MSQFIILSEGKESNFFIAYQGEDRILKYKLRQWNLEGIINNKTLIYVFSKQYKFETSKNGAQIIYWKSYNDAQNFIDEALMPCMIANKLNQGKHAKF